MPILSASTTLSLPAGQAFVFEAGSGAGAAVADPGGRNAKYSIGPQQTAVGPFSTAVNVSVVIASGTIGYRVDLSGTDSADQKPGVVDALLLTGGGLTKGGAALTAGDRASARSGIGIPDLNRSRKEMPTLLVVGDSLTFTNTLDSPTSLQYLDNGYATWAIGLNGYHPGRVINAGVGGEHAYQVAARIDSVLESAGHVDDIMVMVGSNHADNLAGQLSYIESVQYIVDACRNTGANLYLLHNPGFNTDTANLTTIRRSEGAWLTETYSSMPRVTVVDMYPIVMDTSTGDWKANYSYDGSHPGSLGGYFMGKAIPLPPCPLLPSFVGEPGLLSPNPLFTGTAGTNGAGCSGPLATSWSGLCSNTTAVHSQAAESAGLGNEQIVTITASGAGYYMMYASNLSIASGLDIAGVGVIKLESPVGVENVRITTTHSGANNVSWAAKSGNTTAVFTEGFTVKPITRIGTTSASTAVGQIAIRIDFKTAGSAVLKVSRAGIFDMSAI